jgi:hypothetical protein
MRLSAHVTVAALLLLAVTALRAAPVANASDIDKAMNLLPPDVQKDLPAPLPADARNKLPAPPPMSLHCRQLLAEIDRARYAPAQMPHDTYPQATPRYVRPPMTAATPIEGLRIDAGNSSAERQDRAYDRRARLEAQFERECRR